jgi:hypothetical protein
VFRSLCLPGLLLAALLTTTSVRAGTFEEACGALPPVRVSVTVLPLVVLDEVRDDDMRSMTIRTTGAESLHRLATVGTTQADRRWELSYALTALTDPQTGRVCYRPHIAVAVGYEPLQISVAHAFRRGTCGYDAIVAHERGHVEIYNRFLPLAAQSIERWLDTTVSERIVYADDLETAHTDMQRLLHEDVSAIVRLEMAQIQPLHDRFDSVDAALQLLDSCNGAIRRTLSKL